MGDSQQVAGTEQGAVTFDYYPQLDLYECSACAAAVMNRDLHREWHKLVKRGVTMAGIGIGGFL